MNLSINFFISIFFSRFIFKLFPILKKWIFTIFLKLEILFMGVIFCHFFAYIHMWGDNMKTEYEDFNFLKEKLTLLMSKYCIYTFRVKNNRFLEDKETINNYKIFLDYINQILDVMDSSNAEIIKKLFIMKNNWTTLGYSRSSFYDHRRKAVYNFFQFYEDRYDCL